MKWPLTIAGVVLTFVAGIGIGMFGINDPLNFEKAATVIMLVIGALLICFREFLEDL